VSLIALTGDGRVISRGNEYLAVWSLETGQYLQSVKTPKIIEYGCVPEVVASWKLIGNVLNLEREPCLRLLEELYYFKLTDDNRAVNRGSICLLVWDLNTGQMLETQDGDTTIQCFTIIDGDRAVSASAGKTLRVWNLNTGQCLKVLEGHESLINYISLVDGGRVISASSDTTLRVWDIETGQCLKVLKGHTSPVNHVALTSDGRAVSASLDGTLRVWDLDTGQGLKISEEYTPKVYHVAVTDHGRAVSFHNDKTIRVWDLNTGQCLNEQKGYPTCVEDVVLTDDNQAVFINEVKVSNQETYPFSGNRNHCSAFDFETHLVVSDLVTGQRIHSYPINTLNGELWCSRRLRKKVGDFHWFYQVHKPAFLSLKKNEVAIYPARICRGAGEPYSTHGIFFNQANQPHILHLHGPGVDEPEEK